MVRQVGQFVAIGGTGMLLLACAYSENRLTAYAFLIASQATLAFYHSSLGCAYLDIAPRQSAALSSLGNAFSAMGGIAGPLVVAQFLEIYPGHTGWRYVFFTTGGLSVFSLVLWALFQSSEIDPYLNQVVRR
jgi:MFS family permease